MQGYDHFYERGGKPTASRTCPLWRNNEEQHGEELDLATARAKRELAIYHIPFQWEPNPSFVREPKTKLSSLGRVTVAPVPEPVVAPPAAAWPILRAPGSEAPRPAAPVAVWPILRPPRVDEWPSLPAATGGPVAPVAPVVKRPLPAAPYRYTPRL
jgi:hypothetical protein